MVEIDEIKANSVIVIAGPTASGKSGLALDIALRYNGEIINADSMQVYQGTPIISAVPSENEKQGIPHHLYEIYHPSVNGTVVDWLELAVDAIRKIWRLGKLPIVVGGTGLYIDNLINGTTPIPQPDDKIREKVWDIANEGNDMLYGMLKQVDPKGAARLNTNDISRVRRAYEIFLQTGISIDEWYKKPMLKKIPEANFKVIKIIPNTKELDERCYLRFDKMIKQGALDEVKYLQLLNLHENLPAMKMLGVPELMQYLNKRISLKEAVDLAKLHTRQYAKRQRTWFRNKLAADYEIETCF